jgi:hypothetical protein
MTVDSIRRGQAPVGRFSERTGTEQHVNNATEMTASAARPTVKPSAAERCALQPATRDCLGMTTSESLAPCRLGSHSDCCGTMDSPPSSVPVSCS